MEEVFLKIKRLATSKVRWKPFRSLLKRGGGLRWSLHNMFTLYTTRVHKEKLELNLDLNKQAQEKIFWRKIRKLNYSTLMNLLMMHQLLVHLFKEGSDCICMKSWNVTTTLKYLNQQNKLVWSKDFLWW